MSAIQNLYLIPDEAHSAPISALAVVAAWQEAGFLRSVWRAGDALLADGGLLGPRRFFAENPDAKFFEAERVALDQFATHSTPLILVFDAFNEANPSIAADFDHYRGYECWIGAYQISQGFHLRLITEAGLNEAHPHGELLLDRVLHTWIHLQGKAAPWSDQFANSALAQVTQRHWPNFNVIELPYV